MGSPRYTRPARLPPPLTPEQRHAVQLAALWLPDMRYCSELPAYPRAPEATPEAAAAAMAQPIPGLAGELGGLAPQTHRVWDVLRITVDTAHGRHLIIPAAPAEASPLPEPLRAQALSEVARRWPGADGSGSWLVGEGLPDAMSAAGLLLYDLGWRPIKWDAWRRRT